MAALILGPTDWLDDHQPQPPAWIEDHAPDAWSLRGEEVPAPIDVRAALCGHVRRVGSDATILEFHSRRDDETNQELFQRVEKEEQIDRYIVYRPPDAAGIGMEWELGALNDRLAEGRDHDIRLFLHQDAGRLRPDGYLEITEEGRGTGYYQDLVRHDCEVVEWASYEELFRAVGFHVSTA